MPIATNSDTIDISLEVKTAELAKTFSQILKKGDVIFLHGEIGVGKTTFIRYLINNFQKNNNLNLTEVTSPTFNLVNEYDVASFIIKHYDLYRMKSATELNDLNLFEKNDKSILLIEWPQIIKKKPDSSIKLSFEYENDYQKRFIKVLN